MFHGFFFSTVPNFEINLELSAPSADERLTLIEALADHTTAGRSCCDHIINIYRISQVCCLWFYLFLHPFPCCMSIHWNPPILYYGFNMFLCVGLIINKPMHYLQCRMKQIDPSTRKETQSRWRITDDRQKRTEITHLEPSAPMS